MGSKLLWSPKKHQKRFYQTGTLELLGRKKIGLCCTALSERQKIVENPNVSLQPWKSQNVKFVIFWLNFREVAWNLRDLRGLRGACVACVEPACVAPAWPAWNLRGTCVACVEPAWNLRGLRGTCVEPAWPAWNLRAWGLRGLRATCVACVQPAWHLRGTTCIEKPEEFFFFSAWNSKNCKKPQKTQQKPEKMIVVSRGAKKGL